MAIRYKFTDINESPVTELGFVCKFGRTVLDEIPGVQTLAAEGRNQVVREYSFYKNNYDDGDKVLRTKLMPYAIWVDVSITADTDVEFRRILDDLNSILLQGVDRLRFSDDEYYYIASLKRVYFPEIENQTIARLEFLREKPYKYKDITIQGNVFNIKNDLPVVPEQIKLTAKEKSNTSSFNLVNKRSGALIRLETPIKAGDEIIIRPESYFGVELNGKSIIDKLTPASEFERFELEFMDELYTSIKCDCEIIAKLVRVG